MQVEVCLIFVELCLKQTNHPKVVRASRNVNTGHWSHHKAPRKEPPGLGSLQWDDSCSQAQVTCSHIPFPRWPVMPAVKGWWLLRLMLMGSILKMPSNVPTCVDHRIKAVLSPSGVPVAADPPIWRRDLMDVDLQVVRSHPARRHVPHWN